MTRQNPLREIGKFLRDIRKSTGFCRVCMLVGVAGCVVTAILPGDMMAKQTTLGAAAWRVIVGGGAAATWLIAFTCGVLARPSEQRVLLAYPPPAVLKGIWLKGLVFPVAAAVSIGLTLGRSLSGSLLYALAAFSSMNVFSYLALLWGTRATLNAVQRRRDPGVAIADSFQRIWLYYGVLLLSSAWAFTSLTTGSGAPVIPVPALAASTMTGAFAMGYVSGYYP